MVGVIWTTIRVAGAVLLMVAPPSDSSAEVPVRFGDDSSVINLSSGSSVVLIQNDSAGTWTLDVSAKLTNGDIDVPVVVHPKGAEDGSRLELEPAATLSMSLETVTRPARGSGELTVIARPDRQDFELAAAQSVVMRRPIVTTRGTPEAAVDKWQDNAHGVTKSEMSTFVPLADAGGCSTNNDAPAVTKTGSDTSSTAQSTRTTIAQLTLVDGPAAFNAVVTCSASDRAGRGSSLRVTVDGVGPGDQPTGTLKLSDHGSVELTFTKSLPIICALLALGLGFILALAMKWWADNRRGRWLMKRRMASLGQAISSADELFAEERGKLDVAVAHLCLQPGLSHELETANSALEAVASPWPRLFRWLPYPAEQDAKRLGEIVADLDRVESVIAVWKVLPNEFRDLSAHSTDEVGTAAPTLHAKAERFLEAATEVNLATAQEALVVAAEIQSLVAVFKLIPQLLELEALAERANDASADWNEGSKRTLARAEARLRRVAAELRASPDATALIKAGLDRDLRSVQALLRSLPTEPVQATQIEGRRQLDDFRPRPTDIPVYESLRKQWAERSSHAGFVLRVGDVTAIALALVVGTWSGLVALYLDKPWGSKGDFLAMVVWAFASGTAIAVITEAVRLAGDTRLPATGEPRS